MSISMVNGKMTEGDASMNTLLGGKGANLAEMANIGLSGAAGAHHHHRSLRPSIIRTGRQLSGQIHGRIR